MGRYDEVAEAIASGDLATVQARVLPAALVSKDRPCLPLVALRAGRADAAAIVLAAFANDKDNRAPQGLTTPLGHFVHFARSAVYDRMLSAEECLEVTRLGWDAGWRPAGDGHDEIVVALATPELFNALLAVLPPRTTEQWLGIANVGMSRWTVVRPECLARCLSALPDVNAARPGELPLLFVAIGGVFSKAVPDLLERGALPSVVGGEVSTPRRGYVPGMDALAYARAVLELAVATKSPTAANARANVRALEKAAGAKTKKPAKARPQTLEGELQALGKACGLSRAAIDDALAVASPAAGPVAAASRDMALVVDVLARFGQALLDREREAEGDDFLTALLEEPFDGRGTTPEDCEDPEAVRDALTHGIAVATSQGATLLVWNRGERTEVWEVSRHGRPVVHESVLDWLTARRERMHPVE
jgi:hypothetical protein